MSKTDNQNGAFRKKVKFAMVSAIALKDKKLSLRAKGLYGMIQNYITLEDFVIYKNYLVSICGDGKSSFDRAWDELKMNGYLKQYQMQDESGKIYYEYDLLDEPEELSEEDRKAFEKKEANRVARNKRKIEKQKQKKEPVAEVPPMEETTDGSSTHGSSIHGSSTYINNTDEINTDISNTDSKTTTTVVVVDNVVEQYTNYFSKQPNKTTLKKISTYLEKFEVDAVTYAFDIAANKGKEFDYVVGILNNWQSEGLFTFDAAYEANKKE